METLVPNANKVITIAPSMTFPDNAATSSAE
jgi:hypothetical protein